MITVGAIIGVVGLLAIAYGGATVWKAAHPSRMENPNKAPELRRFGEKVAGAGLALAVVGAVLLAFGAVAE